MDGKEDSFANGGPSDRSGRTLALVGTVSRSEAARKAARKAAILDQLPRELVALVERSQQDPGAPFEPATIKRLRRVRAEDPSVWIRVIELLKGLDVQIMELERQTRPNTLSSDGRPKQASRLLNIVNRDCQLFHCREDAFADVENEGYRQTWPVPSRGFNQWLRLRYFQDFSGAPNSEALQTARSTIEAMARFQGPAREVCRRVGSAADKLYLDLCNEAWQAVEIDLTGWRLVDRPAVRFIRTPSMGKLPDPERNGQIEDLERFLNLASHDDFILAISWVLAALRRKGPFPVLVLTGEQGSAKSTCSRLLRSVIDPNDAPLRSAPRSEHDLFIAARNAHVLAFDNLGTVPGWLSDAFCRLSTGAGFGTRELYTNVEEIVISAERPLLLNGIDAVVARGDLTDRAIFLTLKAIPDAERKPESELLADFERVRPKILGALLDAMVVGLNRLGTIRLEGLPRMADFATWGVACETAAFEDGAFMRAYTGNRDTAATTAIEANPVASAILDLMREQSSQAWQGTSSKLYDVLTERVGAAMASARGWPSNPQALSRRVNQIKSALRPAGIVIDQDKGGQRQFHISALEGPPLENH